MRNFYFVENVGSCCNNYFATEKALETISKLEKWDYETTSNKGVVGFSYEEAMIIDLALGWSDIQAEIYLENKGKDLENKDMWKVRKQMAKNSKTYKKIKKRS